MNIRAICWFSRVSTCPGCGEHIARLRDPDGNPIRVNVDPAQRVNHSGGSHVTVDLDDIHYCERNKRHE